MKEILELIGEFIVTILIIPLFIIGAFLFSILYMLYVIYEFINMFIFKKY